MRRRAAVSIHARLERVRAVRRGIAQHRKRRGSLHTPTLDRGKKTPGGAGTCRDTHKGKKTPGGAGIASSLSDANPVPCLSDGQGVKKPCKTPLYFSPRPRARSPPPSTAPCERLVSTHARRPPMDSTRYGLSRSSPRTFLAHHRAAISAAVVLADATRLYRLDHVSLAAPAMSFKLTMGMSPF